MKIFGFYCILMAFITVLNLIFSFSFIGYFANGACVGCALILGLQELGVIK